MNLPKETVGRVRAVLILVINHNDDKEDETIKKMTIKKITASIIYKDKEENVKVSTC